MFLLLILISLRQMTDKHWYIVTILIRIYLTELLYKNITHYYWCLEFDVLPSLISSRYHDDPIAITSVYNFLPVHFLLGFASNFCVFFWLFSTKNSENDYFDQRLECALQTLVEIFNTQLVLEIISEEFLII